MKAYPPSRKQRGFSLVGVMLALVIVSVMLIGFSDVLINQWHKRNAKEYREHIEKVIEQVQQYQYYRITEKNVQPTSIHSFPGNLTELMTVYPGQFWPNCSVAAEQSGQCKRPDGLPWSQARVKYQRYTTGAPEQPRVLLTFPLNTAYISAKARMQWASELQRLPFAQVKPNGDITVMIVNPLSMQVYKEFKEFIKRDGSVALTNTWDVGNQAVLNASAFSVATTTNDQQRLGAGLISEYLAKHLDRVEKSSWSCAVGLKQVLNVSVNAIFSGSFSEKYIGTASFKPYFIDRGYFWELRLDYNAKIQQGGREFWGLRHSGYLNVRLQCKQP